MKKLLDSVTEFRKGSYFASVTRQETKIVVHDSLCEALQAMKIIHLDP